MTDETTPSCDHTSVGVIARNDWGGILLIERKKFPYGWAPPSGHCDGHSFGTAAFKEFEKETGLKIIGAPKPIIPKNPRKYFKCRRGGKYHDWQIFEVNWQGELKQNRDEIRNAKWYTVEEIRELADKTKSYVGRMRALSNPAIPSSVSISTMKVLERDWQTDPGLEIVWCEFFKELKIVP